MAVDSVTLKSIKTQTIVAAGKTKVDEDVEAEERTENRSISCDKYTNGERISTAISEVGFEAVASWGHIYL